MTDINQTALSCLKDCPIDTDTICAEVGKTGISINSQVLIVASCRCNYNSDIETVVCIGSCAEFPSRYELQQDEIMCGNNSESCERA